MKALKHFLTKSTLKIHIPTILRLAELVLNLNSFSFADEHYIQNKGVAMGTKMGPSYACLFVGFVEEEIFSQYKGFFPDFFRRFIDDCIGLSSAPKEQVMDFIQFVSRFHPSLQFTFEISDSSLSFLDIQLSVQPDSHALSTSVFYKPTDSHSYLLFSSSHPPSTKNSIPYSQFLRLRRICSDDQDFLDQAHHMTTFFTSRGYPTDTIREALNRACATSRSQALTPKPTSDTEDRPVLTMVFHPHNLPVKNILLKNFSILQKDPKLCTVFRKPPLVAYKRDTSLRDHLVHSSVNTSQTSLPHGTSPCNLPKCKTCPFISTTTLITGPSGQFRVQSPFTCQSDNLVYILSCTLCSKLYIGETYRTLNERFTEHLRAIRLAYNTPVAVHFNSTQHNLSHVQITAVWQNHSGPSHRKFLESHLISKLGTVIPNGLNTRT